MKRIASRITKYITSALLYLVFGFIAIVPVVNMAFADLDAASRKYGIILYLFGIPIIMLCNMIMFFTPISWWPKKEGLALSLLYWIFGISCAWYMDIWGFIITYTLIATCAMWCTTLMFSFLGKTFQKKG